MIPAPEYRYIAELLNHDSFEIGIHSVTGIKDRQLIAFVLCDQNFKRPPISDFVANLDMMNEHSGKHIYFFLAGVSMWGPNEFETSSKEIGRLGEATLYHNARAMFSFVETFEKEIPSWKYSGGVELILIDVVTTNGRRELDFNSAINFKVEELIRLGIINRTSELFGKLIKLIRESKIEKSRDFQDYLKKEFGIGWYKGLILAMFPKAFGQIARGIAVLEGGAATPD